MKILKGQRKKWHDAHSRKMLKIRSERAFTRKPEHKKGGASFNPQKQHILKVPTELSLMTNLENTVSFFNDVLNQIYACKYKDTLYFDFSGVTVITNDAIMYIIALIRNVRRKKMYSISCRGNVPNSPEARRVLAQSGFYNFVDAQGYKVTIADDCVQISNGKIVDCELDGEICNFVHRVCNNTRADTKRLFSTIIELMTNTNQHAYIKEQSAMEENWYIFAENCSDSVHFVFLDTGVGIPNTIRKNFAEKIRALFSGVEEKAEAGYIASALRGVFRTETNKDYRGKGLPGIYEDCLSGDISELTIISGRGECKVHNGGIIEEYILATPFYGTLFSWKFLK